MASMTFTELLPSRTSSEPQQILVASLLGPSALRPRSHALHLGSTTASGVDTTHATQASVRVAKTNKEATRALTSQIGIFL